MRTVRGQPAVEPDEPAADHAAGAAPLPAAALRASSATIDPVAALAAGPVTAAGPGPAAGRGTRLGTPGLRTLAGQIAATQAAVAAVLAAVPEGRLAVGLAALGSAAVLGAAWLRVRGRWAFQWLDTAVRYAVRRRSFPIASGAALLRCVDPGVTVTPTELGGETAAVVTDAAGVAVILELGDPAGVLVERLPDLPPMAALLPPSTGQTPACRLQLLLTVVPAPALGAAAGTTSATSYRQLTHGRLPGQARALLVVRMLPAAGWSTHELRHALGSVVRRLHKRLGGTPARPLGETAVLRAVAETAHLGDPATARETWAAVRIGGLHQATFQLGWPDPGVDGVRRLIDRLPGLPGQAVTVSFTAESGPSGAGTAAVRIAAPDGPALAIAAGALQAALVAEGAHAQRLDGDQWGGMSTTLPLGMRAVAVVAPPAAPSAAAPFTALPSAAAPRPDPLAHAALPLPGAGLMLGRNRHGEPVITRLFRPEHTRVLLTGGVGCAQLLTFRAMALGAQVVVQTARPQVWEPFVRGTGGPGESITVVPAGRAVQPPQATALRPVLLVLDIGPVAADARPADGWLASLVVRDEFSRADVDVASRADLLLFQPLRADEATLAGSALGLGEAAQWLTRMRPDMLAVVNRRAVRWAALTPTAIEMQLLGPPQRGRSEGHGRGA